MKSKRGFTLIEIMVATIIFAIAIIALVQTGTSSVRSVSESEKLFSAVQLAHSKMGEMLSNSQAFVDKNGVSENLDETKEGKFEPPFDNFSWKSQLTRSKLGLSKAELRSLFSGFGIEDDVIDEKIDESKVLVGNLNKVIKENLVELKVTIEWNQGGSKRTLPLVTHLIPSKPKIEFSLNVDLESDDAGGS